MRLLVVTNLFPPIVRGGYEVECRDVVEHLRADHHVVVLASAHRRRRVPPEPGVLRLLPFSDDSRAGVLAAPLHAVRGVRVLRRVLAAERPDLVYVWNGAGLPHAALHLLHRTGTPVAYRVCEHWFGRLYRGDLFLRFLTPGRAGKDAVWARVVRAVNRLPALRVGAPPRADVAVCWNSRYLRDAVPVPAGLNVVHADVVHPVSAAADALADLPRAAGQDPPTVLYVGRVSPEKGVDVAIAALAELEHRHGRVATLRVVGDGPPRHRDELAGLAAARGVGDRVRFTGPLRGAALHEEISRAAVWVVPSVWDEPAPMVAVEAGLARVPLVASRVGGVPELLRAPSEALHFERGDAAACADRLAETLRGGPAVEERVRRGAARARTLSHGPYLRAMDRFLADAAAALGVRTPGVRATRATGGP